MRTLLIFASSTIFSEATIPPWFISFPGPQPGRPQGTPPPTRAAGDEFTVYGDYRWNGEYSGEFDMYTTEFPEELTWMPTECPTTTETTSADAEADTHSEAWLESTTYDPYNNTSSAHGHASASVSESPRDCADGNETAMSSTLSPSTPSPSSTPVSQ